MSDRFSFTAITSIAMTLKAATATMSDSMMKVAIRSIAMALKKAVWVCVQSVRVSPR